MREIKNSGIEYIGKIPINWKIIRVKDEYLFVTGFTPDTKHSEYYMDDEGYEWVTISDVVNGVIQHPTKSLISREYVRMTHRTKVPKGSLLYSFKLSVGTTAIVDEDIFTNEAIATFLPKANISLDFLKYSSSLIEFNSNTNIYGANILNQKLINDAHIVFPPLREQYVIADFLDSKCAEIDALSADIQSEISTLEAYKRSVITEAVTKGLDKNVPMKDSGTEWLGVIPNHWDISRIGSVYSLRTTKVSDVDYEPLSVTMNGIVPQLESAAKTNAHDDRKLVRRGDFVINSRSDRRGSCGISPMDGSVSLINTVLAPLDEMNPEYYNWLFHTTGFADEFYKYGHGIVDDLWTTGWQDMKRILIPYPPLDEQSNIAKYLNDKCLEIDALLATKQEQFNVLADYKKSIIYEYVTGKKEVKA